jgi:hypothetical protein
LSQWHLLPHTQLYDFIGNFINPYGMKLAHSTAMIRVLAILLFASFVPTSANAHMYSMMDPLYIRVVAHPEMKDYYSYGLCEKKVSKHNRREYDHTHTDCIFPEGQHWWYLPDPQTYSKPDNPWLPTFLIETIQDDDMARAKIFTAEMASIFLAGSIGAKWMGKAIPKLAPVFKIESGNIPGVVHAITTKAPWYKTAPRAFTRGVGTLFIDMVAYGSFWEGATSITKKITHSYWQKSQPYTDYIHYIDQKMGLNEQGIEVNLADFTLPKAMQISVDPKIIQDGEKTVAHDPDSLHAFKDCFPDSENVFMPKDMDCLDLFIGRQELLEKNRIACFNHCGENITSIRASLSKVYDPYGKLIPGITGCTKFGNCPVDPETGEPDINWAQEIFEYKSDGEVCEMQCDQQWRTPTIKELWFKVSQQLAASDHHQYQRVLFDYGVEVFPWSDHTPNLQITYLKSEDLRRFAGDARYKGPCPIGSECDKKYKFNRKTYETLEKPSYVKTDLWKLTQNYSGNVWHPMTPVIHKTLPGADLSKPQPRLLSEKLTHFDYTSVHDLIRNFNNRYYIRGDCTLESIELYSIRGEKQDVAPLYNTETQTLDLNSLATGTYVIQIKLAKPAEKLIEKVLVTH